jgi:hypothetical protein
VCVAWDSDAGAMLVSVDGGPFQDPFLPPKSGGSGPSPAPGGPSGSGITKFDGSSGSKVRNEYTSFARVCPSDIAGVALYPTISGTAGCELKWSTKGEMLLAKPSTDYAPFFSKQQASYALSFPTTQHIFVPPPLSMIVIHHPSEFSALGFLVQSVCQQAQGWGGVGGGELSRAVGKGGPDGDGAVWGRGRRETSKTRCPRSGTPISPAPHPPRAHRQCTV